jgi:hypothetical protein
MKTIFGSFNFEMKNVGMTLPPKVDPASGEHSKGWLTNSEGGKIIRG